MWGYERPDAFIIWQEKKLLDFIGKHKQDAHVTFATILPAG
jgi:hypothetical protein